jgi:hypothetical protein
VAGGSGATRSATDARFRIATVEAVYGGGRVSVAGDSRALRLEGVPAGWKAAAGDRVAVGPSLDTGGVTAQQLIGWVAYSGSAAELVPGRRLGGPAGPLMTGATTISPPLAELRGKGDQAIRPFDLAIADSEAPDSMQRIIAVREG